MEWIDRELSEAVWQESLDMMTPEELAEMVRRQDEARKADYFSKWPTNDGLAEVCKRGINDYKKL